MSTPFLKNFEPRGRGYGFKKVTPEAKNGCWVNISTFQKGSVHPSCGSRSQIFQLSQHFSHKKKAPTDLCVTLSAK
jgi:hypothetical protein